MKKNCKLIILPEWVEMIRMLPPEEQAGAFFALADYNYKDGYMSDDLTIGQKMVLMAAANTIDNNIEKYEKKRQQNREQYEKSKQQQVEVIEFPEAE